MAVAVALAPHRDFEGADFPYCATSMDMLVPAGHLKVTTSSSHPAR